jgi:hypothetical protein
MEGSIYDALPEHVRGGMQRYLEQGIPPGGYLHAFLSNDLHLAVKRADAVNRYRMLELLDWLIEHAHPLAWGTPQRVEAWIALHALERGKGGGS